ncbi:MAG: FHA domain-containing protein, partial [Actinomycetaceae bacterium]|nr:FHA domain-containing protein [Actinomycetaceae bacterium]
ALGLTILRIGFLAMLWIFVFAIVLFMRRDIYGTRFGERRKVQKKKKKPAAPAQHQAPTPAPARSSKNPSLVVTDGALAGTTIPLGHSDIIVGRSPDSALVLNDTYSSSRHARFFLNEGAWWVEDLQSTNGTYINGQKLTAPVQLRPGMAVTVGRTTMELRV